MEKDSIGTEPSVQPRKVVKGENLNDLVGKLLTIIDATYVGEESSWSDMHQSLSPKSAIKDLIKNSVWSWFYAVPPEDD